MKVQRILWWLLTVGCACTILTLSLLPASQSAKISAPLANWVIEQDQTIQELPSKDQIGARMNKHNGVRDMAHVFMYTVFSVCTGMLVYTYSKKRWYIISIPACIVFGCLDELLQHLLATGRVFQMSDVWRDWLGTAIGAAIVVVIHIRHKTKQEAGAYGVSSSGT